jgi:hypothetical protein
VGIFRELVSKCFWRNGLKIKAGNDIDYHQCIAIKHEYFRCRDAFDQFRYVAENLVLNGKNKYKSYRAYNAYSYFILHLYEFLLACHARDSENPNVTNKKGLKKAEFLDSLIHEDTLRVVNSRIDRIKQGRAPSCENDLSHYEGLLPIPSDFGKNFRTYRNKVVGHASYERTRNLNLSKFFNKYHQYLYLLYVDVGDHWGRESDEFPEFEDVTNFLSALSDT